MTTDIKIARYELYPADEPNCYCVGFSVSTNGRSMYCDTQVPLSGATGMTDTQIAEAAYEKVKTNIDSWVAMAQSKAPLLGSTFQPPATPGATGV